MQFSSGHFSMLLGEKVKTMSLTEHIEATCSAESKTSAAFFHATPPNIVCIFSKPPQDSGDNLKRNYSILLQGGKTNEEQPRWKKWILISRHAQSDEATSMYSTWNAPWYKLYSAISPGTFQMWCMTSYVHIYHWSKTYFFYPQVT